MSGDQNHSIPPLVLWAQRKNCVYLTICLEDCKNPDLKLENGKVSFKGVGGTEKKNHEFSLTLYKEIDPEKSINQIKDRNIELFLRKKEDEFWPQITKEKTKYHWLKVDFDKWKDEDDSEDEFGGVGGQSDDLEEMMRSMGGLGGSGDKADLDDLDIGPSDSDDEEDDGPPALE